MPPPFVCHDTPYERGTTVERRHRTAPARSAVAVGALAGAAAVIAVVMNHQLYPLYSLNRDDSVYVAIARMIGDGRFTLPESHWPFRPWASGLVDDRIVPKYAPPWPAALAFGDALGSMRVTLGVVAGLSVVAVRALAFEVLHDVRTATLAAGLLVVSPLFAFQSGTYLAYVFSLLLGVGAAAMLLRGARTGSWWRLAVGAALAGLAAFARPFDAAILVVPVVIAIVAARSEAAGSEEGVMPLRRMSTAVAAGIVPMVTLIAVYNAAVLGNPFTMPFTVTGDADSFGFGRRGVFESSTLPFDFGDGLSGAGRSLQWFPSWLFGGPVLLAIGLVGLFDVLRHGRGPARWAVASWLVVVPVAFIWFWGPWAMTHNWDGVQAMGPFYHLAVLVPCVVFGAHGLWLLVRERPAFAAGAAIAMLAFTAWSLPDKFDRNDQVTDEYRAVERAVADADLHDAILFLPLRGEAGFLSITPFLENGPDLDASVLYAEDCGTAANRAVLAARPQRSGFRLEVLDGSRPERADSFVVLPLDADADDRRIDCGR